MEQSWLNQFSWALQLLSLSPLVGFPDSARACSNSVWPELEMISSCCQFAGLNSPPGCLFPVEALLLMCRCSRVL
ncbi:hypothetical protein Nepgr_029670 [Nepenthes gracilis]|uniref:Secreted protein n=1 Tax=Nepenthes gracilis TaxID=150966 RepID=A0AAD3TFS7_NEPGR|nr:hypothetical protein Nepgr_029670 [Nepenthes gracilis]